MPNYTVQYTRLNPRKELEAIVTSKTMDGAVEKVVTLLTKELVNVTNISVSIKSETRGGIQRYCDVCLVSMASYGVKNNWYCRECKQ